MVGNMNGARSGRLAFQSMSAWLLLWVLSAVEVCAWSGMAEGFYWSSENAIHMTHEAYTVHASPRPGAAPGERFRSTGH